MFQKTKIPFSVLDSVLYQLAQDPPFRSSLSSQYRGSLALPVGFIAEFSGALCASW